MSRKLPRTLQRTIHDIRREMHEAEQAQETPQAEAQKTPSKAAPAQASPAPEADARAEAPANASATTSGGQPEGKAQTTTEREGAERTQAPRPKGRALATRPPTGSALRRARARLIIERHSTLAGIAGFVPLPWVDLAAVAALVARMLRELSRCYRIPLDRDRSGRIALSLLAGVGAPGIASFTTTSLLRMAPGPNLVGMTVTAAAAVALTRVIGDVFLERLERGEPPEGAGKKA
ncbi:DUF697 domain-containing protein [Stappia indica]|uniref:DUF697 domain-containing protein n=1 Tax=Stappia indica TaxID=538381 RepID=UPI001D18FC74|nr:DUF697 domain-containing protein [Stappia indica]MCC4246116.1 YcjF family protein [Stappia indica]